MRMKNCAQPDSCEDRSVAARLSAAFACNRVEQESEFGGGFGFIHPFRRLRNRARDPFGKRDRDGLVFAALRVFLAYA